MYVTSILYTCTYEALHARVYMYIYPLHVYTCTHIYKYTLYMYMDSRDKYTCLSEASHA